MAMGQMDALGAFTYLSDNLPAWSTRISDLATHAAAKHAEFAAAYKRVGAVKHRRQKNSSICSIRTDDTHSMRKNSAAPGRRTRNDGDDGSNASHAQIPRKRGQDEVSSLNSDERLPFVSVRYNVVIHYDGHTQKALEDLVRNIGTARNNLRKGKISQFARPGMRMNLLSKSLGTNNGSSSALSQTDSPDNVILTGVRSTRTRTVQKESAFDFADRQLELAHGFCESAAHQFLRFGDCAAELEGVEEKFKVLLEMANNEVERLKAERAQESKDSQAKVPAVKTLPAKTIPLTAQSLKPPSPAFHAIEVDDAETSSVESIDMSAFRSARNRM